MINYNTKTTFEHRRQSTYVILARLINLTKCTFGHKYQICTNVHLIVWRFVSNTYYVTHLLYTHLSRRGEHWYYSVSSLSGFTTKSFLFNSPQLKQICQNVWEQHNLQNSQLIVLGQRQLVNVSSCQSISLSVRVFDTVLIKLPVRNHLYLLLLQYISNQDVRGHLSTFHVVVIALILQKKG